MNIKEITLELIANLLHLRTTDINESDNVQITISSAQLANRMAASLFKAGEGVYLYSGDEIIFLDRLNKWDLLLHDHELLRKKMSVEKYDSNRTPIDYLRWTINKINSRYTKEGKQLFDLCDKVISYFRAIVIVLESVKDETHRVRNLLNEKSIIPAAERAIETLRTVQQEGLKDFDSFGAYDEWSDLWKSPYPIQRYQQRIRELEEQIKQLTEQE
ncbi:hypothetical protein [Gloeothece verrucosa]|uniref:Uncharacterized protein n=1 Tax=Gloeothece verrucosa (strain PCC 7822) TaxID=497965 RepID=E0U6Z1_GLOV7|nr:hypothetical protein [Gloeothece verrucosa]ADN16028.1 hypothetical protein Cyan7822_4108 [Gloeothece verrucosa PCC 7822]